jgi:hypothetical protein
MLKYINTGKSLSTACRRTSSLTPEGFPIGIDDVEELDNMLDTIGAGRRLDQNGNWVYNRDFVDERIIKSYLNGTGSIIGKSGLNLPPIPE